jgi:carbohydrate diacid regulator
VEAMPNKMFQNILRQYKEIVNRDIGIIDDSGFILACTDEGKIGGNNGEYFKEDAAAGRRVAGGCTYKPADNGEYILFIDGEDAEAYKILSLLCVSLSGLKNIYDDQFNKSLFIKNVILDNILPGDIYAKAKELNFTENTCRIAYLIKCAAQSEYNLMEIMQNMFPDKNKDFVLNLDGNAALIKEISKTDDTEAIAKELVSTLNSEFFIKATVGIGGPADEIKDLSRSYKEAQIALEVGKVFDNEKEVINYKNLGIGRIIYQLPTTLCEVFLQEVFKEGSLESLDRESLMTIQSFFENSLNVSETSRKLFVHRNTLVYRLEKIKRLTGLDLREFEHAIVFKVALMVKKYLASAAVRY